MNHAVVVDASVAVKWVLFEEITNQARAFYEANLRAHRPIFAPPHFRSEVSSALYQRARTRETARRITAEEVQEALRRFSRFRVQTMEPADLYERAFNFATNHELPNIYDSIYVILAQILNTELWTDDRRLLNTVRSDTPWVHWIGDYPVGA
jgi:predicted nucleic acid-binding protein